jgi:CRISPR-associated protein Cmr3
MRQEGIQLVGQKISHRQQTKPFAGAPTYWFWEHIRTWLEQPESTQWQQFPLHTLGLRELPRERRVHVAIDAATRAGKEGMLFDTSGLEFMLIEPSPYANSEPTSAEQQAGSSPLHRSKHLALAVILPETVNDQKHDYHLQPGPGNFGSERRIVNWLPSHNRELLTCPEQLSSAITQEKYCRLILLTPAYFERGEWS